MATITSINYSRAQTSSFSHAFGNYNKYALASFTFAALFISYFLVPHSGILSPVMNFSVFFVVFAPFIGLLLSVISIKQISRTHNKGMVLSYISLGITGVYFMVALAIPVVLIGLYFVYTYIL